MDKTEPLNIAFLAARLEIHSKDSSNTLVARGAMVEALDVLRLLGTQGIVKTTFSESL
jgi:hypothetical protein